MSAMKDLTEKSNKIVNSWRQRPFQCNSIAVPSVLPEHVFNKGFQINGLRATAEWEQLIMLTNKRPYRMHFSKRALYMLNNYWNDNK